MELKGYQTLSPAIKNQIEKLSDIWKRHLGASLVGIYIHGSLALSCFLEGVSDIDILIISDRRIPKDERLSLAKDIINIDCEPSPLEMSAIWINDVHPWKYPTRCQFHYSDYWTERYKKILDGELQELYITDNDFEDEDIASYVHLINQCGICVYGKPEKEVFPIIPEHDFWQSISNNIDEYDFNAYNPRYFVSNILILGRILSYKKEKKILSKYDGGVWTLHYVPERFRYIIDNALNSWYMGEKTIEYKQDDLEGLKQFLGSRNKII